MSAARPRPSRRTVLGAFAAVAAAATLAATPPAKPATQVVRIIATDFAFELPDTLRAGRTEVQLVSRGKELHHAAIVRLDEGHTMNDLFAAFKAGGPPPTWAHEMGGPNAGAPGAPTVAVVDLVPGSYVLLCMIPSPDGTPHVMKGMSRAFTVVPASPAPTVTPVARRTGGAPAAAAMITREPDVTMTLEDYAFRVSRPLTKGRRVVRVRNDASQPHEVFIARLAPGTTATQALAWIEKMQGPPPLKPMGGTVGLSTGMSNDILLDLTPGEYALFCFVPDAKDGKPHVAHGMVQQISVR
ncbi:MAG TPA: hypothetical protein VEZ47_00655 [Gemmatirosa sp.]|nr:hypothetical protein [Gemmatirosa sp.]